MSVFSRRIKFLRYERKKTIVDFIFINTFYFFLRKKKSKGEVMYLKYLIQNF